MVQRSRVPSNTNDLGVLQTFMAGESNGRSQLSGVAYEWRGKLVFWTDRLQRKVGVTSSDGRFTKTLIEGDANFQPTAIVVHSDEGALNALLVDDMCVCE